ncbi:MAG: hypothetical protein VYA34_10025 [Myxococcota bacterium]|nr:hypothetical protein [Myxococcota bacterium]
MPHTRQQEVIRSILQGPQPEYLAAEPFKMPFPNVLSKATKTPTERIGQEVIVKRLKRLQEPDQP